MAIHWGMILTHLPTLVEAASHLFKKADKPTAIPAVPANGSEAQLDAVIKRLEYFESLESEQAKLLQQTIEQLQNVSMSAAALSKRANIALALAVISLGVAAVAIIY